MKRILQLFLVTIAFAALLGCTSCTTPATGTASQTQQVLTEAGKVLGPALVQTLAVVGQQELSGQKVSATTAASEAANALWSNVGNVTSSSTVSALVLQQGETSLPGLATAAAAAFDQSSNTDAGEKVNAIAAVISALAGAPPAVSTVK